MSLLKLHWILNHDDVSMMREGGTGAARDTVKRKSEEYQGNWMPRF